MNSRRLRIVLLHTWYHFTHSMETWVDLFWNPVIQTWIYALIAVSFAQSGNQQGHYIIMGTIFWQVIWVGQYAIAVGALWEIWSKSFSSMFISPLSMNEYIVGQMISGSIKSFLAVAMTSIVAFFLYQFSIFSFGWMLPIYFIECLIFSWATGLMILSLIFRFSTQVQSLSWALIFLVQPLGAVFYPATVLPVSIRWISYGLPVTYVFETIRAQMVTHTVDWHALAIATSLNAIWMIAGWFIFVYTFAAAKRNGSFARLEG